MTDSVTHAAFVGDLFHVISGRAIGDALENRIGKLDIVFFFHTCHVLGQRLTPVTACNPLLGKKGATLSPKRSSAISRNNSRSWFIGSSCDARTYDACSCHNP